MIKNGVKRENIAFLGACYGTEGLGFESLWTHHNLNAWRLNLVWITVREPNA